MSDNNQQGQYTGGFSFGDQSQQGGFGQAQPQQPAQPVQPSPQAPAQPVQPVQAQPASPTPPTPPAGQTTQPTVIKADDKTDEGDGYIFGEAMNGFTTSITLPDNNLDFDEAYFTRLLAGSISLSRDEKKKILDSIPKLRQAQVDELIRIFEEEKAKFIELSPKHGKQLKKLEQEHIADWRDIEVMFEQETKTEEDSAKADEIRKQLGL